MTENLLRERLARIAAGVGPVDLADEAVRGAHRVRRRRAVLAASLSLVLIGGLAGLGIALQPNTPATGLAQDARPTTAAPALSPNPSTSGSRGGATVPDSAFAVAAPVLHIGGPLGRQQPPCLSAEVTATAKTRRVPGGVVGVVRLRGRACSLAGLGAPYLLLDARGIALGIPVPQGAVAVNPPGNGRPDLALGAGDAAWGFAWTGTFCGEPAAAVVLPLSPRVGEPATERVTAALTGPSPRCTQGLVGSTFQPGVPGGPTDPVLPVPADWSALRLNVLDSGASTVAALTGLRLRVTNTGDADVLLTPCVAYSGVVSGPVLDQGSAGPAGYPATELGTGGRIACGPEPLVVPAGSSVQVRLADVDLTNSGFVAGTKVAVKIAIASIPTAITTVILR